MRGNERGGGGAAPQGCSRRHQRADHGSHHCASAELPRSPAPPPPRLGLGARKMARKASLAAAAQQTTFECGLWALNCLHTRFRIIPPRESSGEGEGGESRGEDTSKAIPRVAAKVRAVPASVAPWRRGAVAPWRRGAVTRGSLSFFSHPVLCLCRGVLRMATARTACPKRDLRAGVCAPPPSCTVHRRVGRAGEARGRLPCRRAPGRRLSSAASPPTPRSRPISGGRSSRKKYGNSRCPACAAMYARARTLPAAPCPGAPVSRCRARAAAPPPAHPIHLNPPRCTPIHLNPPQSTSIHLNPPHYAPIHLNPPHCTQVHLNPPHCTSLHLDLPQSTPIHPNPPQSAPMHLNPSYCTPIHLNPSKSTPIHLNPPQSTSLHPNPPQSTSLTPIHLTAPHCTPIHPNPPQSTSIHPNLPQFTPIHPPHAV